MDGASAAVVFDLDGTLLNTLDDLADSMNAVLAASGHPVHPVEAYRFFVGDGMASLVRRALPKGRRDAAAVAAAGERMRSEYDRRWADKTRPYPGVPELLDGLAARGLRLAVLSNKPDDFTRATVARLLDRWRFDAVQGLRSDLPRKPDPTAARAMAAALGLPTGRCLYVGDSSTDMVTARGAGMFAVGAAWGFRDREELVAAGAQAIAASPAQVLELL
ncbi:MAG: HAD family hydrolase [Gemmatimonadota bacterium]